MSEEKKILETPETSFEVTELIPKEIDLRIKPNCEGSYQIITQFFKKIEDYSTGKIGVDIPAFNLIRKLSKKGGDNTLEALSVGISFCETCSGLVEDSNVSSLSKSEAASWISIVAVKWCAGKDIRVSVQHGEKSETVDLVGLPSAILSVRRSDKLVDDLLAAYQLKETGLLISAICVGSKDHSTIGALKTVAAVAEVLMKPENLRSARLLAESAQEEITTCCVPFFSKCCLKKKKVKVNVSQALIDA
jgi:hypothetical protein